MVFFSKFSNFSNFSISRNVRKSIDFFWEERRASLVMSENYGDVEFIYIAGRGIGLYLRKLTNLI